MRGSVVNYCNSNRLRIRNDGYMQVTRHMKTFGKSNPAATARPNTVARSEGVVIGPDTDDGDTANTRRWEYGDDAGACYPGTVRARYRTCGVVTAAGGTTPREIDDTDG